MITYATIKTLAANEGLSVKDLCALAPKNDPFYVGRPAEMAAAEWFAGLWQQFGYDTGVHLRRMHYRLISQDPPLPRPNGEIYLNTDRDWDYLNEASKWARYLNLVSPSAFVDRRNPEAIILARWKRPGDWLYADPTPNYEILTTFSQDDYNLPELPELDNLPDDIIDLPTFEVRGYSDIQQDYHIECWVEKTTMNDVLEPLCRRYGVNLVTGAGELSITAVVEFLKRVRRAERPARIIYISDYDPAGLGMPISVARKIEFFQRNDGHHDLDIRLQPIVLTTDQVAAYDLPRVPVKDTDLRKANFEVAHGEGQVELDALEALYPGELAQITETAILQWYDPTLEERAEQQRLNLIDILDAEKNAVIEDHQDAIDDLTSDYAELLDTYSATQERFQELIQDFQPEIDAHNAHLESIKRKALELHQTVLDDLYRVEIDLGDDNFVLPVPDLPDDDDGLLYDSRREYFDQLVMYKSYRLGLDGNGDEAE